MNITGPISVLSVRISLLTETQIALSLLHECQNNHWQQIHAAFLSVADATSAHLFPDIYLLSAMHTSLRARGYFMYIKEMFCSNSVSEVRVWLFLITSDQISCPRSLTCLDAIGKFSGLDRLQVLSEHYRVQLLISESELRMLLMSHDLVGVNKRGNHLGNL